MANKKKKLQLLAVVFVVLLAVVIIVQLSGKKNKSSGLKGELLNLDTAAITSYSIRPKGEKEWIEFNKESNHWTVTKAGKTYEADPMAARNAFEVLGKLRTKQVAATTKNKWAQYDVTDSAACRIVLKVGTETVGDLYIGKFDFKQQAPSQQNPYARQSPDITSYARLADDEVVYGIDGMLSMMFNREFSAFRRKDIVNANTDLWTKISFRYPADSSFILEKNGQTWTANKIVADSAAVADYLNEVSYLSSSNFSEPKVSGSPLYSVRLEGNTEVVEVNVFEADSLNRYFIQSTANPTATFADPDGYTVRKLCTSYKQFTTPMQ